MWRVIVMVIKVYPLNPHYAIENLLRLEITAK